VTEKDFLESKSVITAIELDKMGLCTIVENEFFLGLRTKIDVRKKVASKVKESY